MDSRSGHHSSLVVCGSAIHVYTSIPSTSVPECQTGLQCLNSSTDGESLIVTRGGKGESPHRVGVIKLRDLFETTRLLAAFYNLSIQANIS